MSDEATTDTAAERSGTVLEEVVVADWTAEHLKTEGDGDAPEEWTARWAGCALRIRNHRDGPGYVFFLNGGNPSEPEPSVAKAKHRAEIAAELRNTMLKRRAERNSSDGPETGEGQCADGDGWSVAEWAAGVPGDAEKDGSWHCLNCDGYYYPVDEVHSAPGSWRWRGEVWEHQCWPTVKREQAFAGAVEMEQRLRDPEPIEVQPSVELQEKVPGSKARETPSPEYLAALARRQEKREGAPAGPDDECAPACDMEHTHDGLPCPGTCVQQAEELEEARAELAGNGDPDTMTIGEETRRVGRDDDGNLVATDLVEAAREVDASITARKRAGMMMPTLASCEDHEDHVPSCRMCLRAQERPRLEAEVEGLAQLEEAVGGADAARALLANHCSAPAVTSERLVVPAGSFTDELLEASRKAAAKALEEDIPVNVAAGWATAAKEFAEGAAALIRAMRPGGTHE